MAADIASIVANKAFHESPEVDGATFALAPVVWSGNLGTTDSGCLETWELDVPCLVHLRDVALTVSFVSGIVVHLQYLYLECAFVVCRNCSGRGPDTESALQDRRDRGLLRGLHFGPPAYRRSRTSGPLRPRSCMILLALMCGIFIAAPPRPRFAASFTLLLLAALFYSLKALGGGDKCLHDGSPTLRFTLPPPPPHVRTVIQVLSRPTGLAQYCS
ncbi:hypothetical protein NDU88_001861 [Pleurodeles waltl]|uniref:Uncharacterized protein n=1 Tax=Pleurodeles waltl TaxID=8319 RepID=A0AAV7LE35_PLEWA|nr:hypothetical protein NDU88_001861 [Pleurodeles waltl]